MYTVIVFSENKPGLLYRVAGLFLKRKINIESLTVSETETKGISRFTIVVKTDAITIEKVVKQLYRVVEVLKVFETVDKEIIAKELAFMKVSAKNPQRRREIEDVAYLFQAKISYVSSDAIVIEKAGTEDTIDSMISLLRPFGIKELTRTGRIAVLKDESKTQGKFGNLLKEPSETAMNLDISAIKRIQLMSYEVDGAVSLAQGIPSFETYPHIRQAAIEAINQGKADKYTPGYGIEPLRNVIVEKIRRNNNIHAEMDNVMVTHGGIEAVMAIFLTMMNPTDEILVPTPDYASHITQVQIARHGGRPIFVPLTETDEGWIFDPAKLEAAITPKTKAILICNPCNPTGKIYSKEELKQIADIAIRHNLFIVSDEMYEYFTYDGKEHISIGSFPEVRDRVITVYGVSKSYCMTGWRIGYIVAEQSIIKQIMKIHDSLVTCPTAVSQYAAIAAISGLQENVAYYKKEFMKRRDIVMHAIKQTEKLHLSAPEGSYFAFVRFNLPVDDYAFSVRAIKDAQVAVVPGSAFGVGGENHIRISFGCEEDQLTKGLDRLVSYVKKTM